MSRCKTKTEIRKNVVFNSVLTMIMVNNYLNISRYRIFYFTLKTYVNSSDLVPKNPGP